MSKVPSAPAAKPSFWATLRRAWGPYKRLYGYAAPYKGRFVAGLIFGFLTGGISSCLPLVMTQVTSFIFHGAAPGLAVLRQHPEMLQTGGKINSIIGWCLMIPLVMTARCERRINAEALRAKEPELAEQFTKEIWSWRLEAQR